MKNKYCLNCGKELVGKHRKYCCSKCACKFYYNSEKGREATKRRNERKGIKQQTSDVEQEIGIKAKNINEIVKFRKEHPEEFVELPYGCGFKSGERVEYLETSHLIYCDGLSAKIQKELPKIIEDVSNKLVNEELTEEDIIEIEKRKKKRELFLKDKNERYLARLRLFTKTHKRQNFVVD